MRADSPFQHSSEGCIPGCVFQSHKNAVFTLSARLRLRGVDAPPAALQQLAPPPRLALVVL